MNIKLFRLPITDYEGYCWCFDFTKNLHPYFYSTGSTTYNDSDVYRFELCLTSKFCDKGELRNTFSLYCWLFNEMYEVSVYFNS